MRVSLVDPSAFTPPYDRSLAAALARAGAEVELATSEFQYGSVPPAEGYSVRESFYGLSNRLATGSRLRLPLKALEHGPEMLRFGPRGRRADVVHWQWVTIPAVDRFLVAAAGRPRVLTLHYPLPSAMNAEAIRRERRFLAAFDAVVAHTEHGAARLRSEFGLAADRVHVIPHGPLDYLTRMRDARPLPTELAGAPPGAPVILFFGLLRPYKGIDTLLEAFAALGETDAELWIAGMPRMEIGPLEIIADRARGTVRWLPRFVTDDEIPALFERADVLALPYREIEQSGVLHAGLAFGKPMVLGDVGGFGEIGREGAAALVPPGDPVALAETLQRLVADPEERARLAGAARAAGEGERGWDAIAARTLALYRSLR